MNPFLRKTSTVPFHHRWTDSVRTEPPRTATDSPLLALGRSSDVNPLRPEQVTDAREVLRLRTALVENAAGPSYDAILAGQRTIVERFLTGRRAYFDETQSRPLDDIDGLIRDGRDIFLVVKFMDESPHLAATLDSLTNQRDIDLRRVVIVAVDNNSTDGSDAIVRSAIERNTTDVRMVYLNQAMPGAGNAARLGVDTCIATVYEMCRVDGNWARLQTATIAVSDGDTVYHPSTLDCIAQIFEDCPTVDAVMPFLTYKFTAALRLFRGYRPAYPDALAAATARIEPTEVPVDLATIHAYAEFPRAGRHAGPDAVTLAGRTGESVVVPLLGLDEHGRRFGVMSDPAGRLAYIFADRTLVLAEAPVSGYDAALVFLENGGTRRDEKWRWHTVIGHDLFLFWAFAGMGIPEYMIFPDTSDALKTIRVWSFAIGGQHQLRRPGLRIATGSDYQSGRVLQSVGCTARLGPAEVFAETETDRLIKMVRNFSLKQSVFYGETRSEAIERATGLYVHMTRIQGDIEREMREYDDAMFEHTAFPERVLFPLRWMVQNAVRYYAHGPRERQIVRERVLTRMFPADICARIEGEILTPAALDALTDAPYSDKQVVAERIAEAIIVDHYPHIMDFYTATLRSFFAAKAVDPECYEWLLEGIASSRNALADQPAPVDPAEVWNGSEFDIDVARGQVVGMRRRPAREPHLS